jgi:O-antigen biosynthesis protein WbqP
VIRLFDIFFSVLGLVLGSPVLLILLLAGYFDTGSPIFRQVRVGKNQMPFTLFKYRTMDINSKSVATHLISRSLITPFGHFLRKTKLDELPQLWNVLRGDMSLVGPRPGLYNQEELTLARIKLNIYNYLPGVTGLSQLRGVDMSTPDQLAETDLEMLKALTLKRYFHLIFLTAMGKGSGDRVSR